MIEFLQFAFWGFLYMTLIASLSAAGVRIFTAIMNFHNKDNDNYSDWY